MVLTFTSKEDHVLSAHGVYKASARYGLISLSDACYKEPNVTLAFFLQWNSCNTPSKQTSQDLFERLESRVLAEATRHELSMVVDVNARPVSPVEGYSTDGYLVTAQGYRARSMKKI